MSFSLRPKARVCSKSFVLAAVSTLGPSPEKILATAGIVECEDFFKA